MVTWGSWTAAAAVAGGNLSATGPHPVLRTVLLLLGVFAPGYLALWFTARQQGGAGLRELLGRLVRFDVPARWYLFAIGFMAAIKLTVALLLRIATGAWPAFGTEPWWIMLGATFLSLVLLGQAGEELGWRGYALPRLTARFGLARASLLLGVIWALWHLPLFLIPGTDTTGQSFPLYLLQVTAISVAIAWLYARTNGSLWLTMLLHSAGNNTKDIVPSYVPGATNPLGLSTSRVAWLTVALLWLCAGYFLARMSRMSLEP